MSQVSVTELSKELRSAIAKLETSGNLDEVGIVLRVGDGVVWVQGLRNAGYSEVLEIQTEKGVVEAFDELYNHLNSYDMLLMWMV